jgi:hypothetical protein
MQRTESTVRPGAISVERHAGLVHVVLAENIVQTTRDGSTLFVYDQTRIVTDETRYRTRTALAWKALATPEVYEGCVRTENGLYPRIVVDKGARVALDPVEAAALATNTDIKEVAEEQVVTKG